MYLIVVGVGDGYSSPRVVATAANFLAYIRGMIAVQAELKSARMIEPGVFVGENPQGIGTPVTRREWVRGDTLTTAARVEWWGNEPHYT